MKQKPFTAFLIASLFLLAPFAEVVSAYSEVTQESHMQGHAAEIPHTEKTADAKTSCPHHGMDYNAHSKNECKGSYPMHSGICSISVCPPSAGGDETLFSAGQEFIPEFESVQPVIGTSFKIDTASAYIAKRSDSPDPRPPTA